METFDKHFFSDMGVMLGRSMRHIFRSLDTIITVTIMTTRTSTRMRTRTSGPMPPRSSVSPDGRSRPGRSSFSG